MLLWRNWKMLLIMFFLLTLHLVNLFSANWTIPEICGIGYRWYVRWVDCHHRAWSSTWLWTGVTMWQAQSCVRRKLVLQPETAHRSVQDCWQTLGLSVCLLRKMCLWYLWLIPNQNMLKKCQPIGELSLHSEIRYF